MDDNAPALAAAHVVELDAPAHTHSLSETPTLANVPNSDACSVPTTASPDTSLKILDDEVEAQSVGDTTDLFQLDQAGKVEQHTNAIAPRFLLVSPALVARKTLENEQCRCSCTPEEECTDTDTESTEAKAKQTLENDSYRCPCIPDNEEGRCSCILPNDEWRCSCIIPEEECTDTDTKQSSPGSTTQCADTNAILADVVAPLPTELAEGSQLGESAILQTMRRVLGIMAFVTVSVSPLSVIYYLGAEYFSACTGM